jgi:hypothetical protein
MSWWKIVLIAMLSFSVVLVWFMHRAGRIQP